MVKHAKPLSLARALEKLKSIGLLEGDAALHNFEAMLKHNDPCSMIGPMTQNFTQVKLDKILKPAMLNTFYKSMLKTIKPKDDNKPGGGCSIS